MTDIQVVEDLGDTTVVPVLGRAPFVTRTIRHQQEAARRHIAYSLVILLTAAMAALFVLLGIHVIQGPEAKDLLSTVLAPLVGLVGAATGFYFGGGGSDET